MPHRRILPAAAAALVVLAACGSSASTSLDTVATTVPSSVSSPSTTDGGIPVATNTAEPIDESAADSTESRAGPLSMQGTLLPDDAFPTPWEMQRRTYDNITFDYGPFQSSCRGYELAEQFAGRSEATVFWWVDGGNANHFVGRAGHPGEGDEFVAAVAAAADSCDGVVSWGEGGEMRIESLDLGEDIGGFSMVTFPGDDLGYVAAMTHGDLIAVLWVPMWRNAQGEIPDLTTEGFAAVARQALDLLRAARPATPSEMATTTTTTTATTSPVVTSEPGIRPDPTLPTTTLPATTTTTVAPTGLALLLLTPEALGPEWRVENIEPYTSSPSDPDLAEACPAAASVDAADASFEWASELERDDGVNMGQLIGRVDDVATATEIAEQFAALTACDLTEEFGDLVSYTGGPVEIDGATAAGELSFVAPDENLVATTVLVATGDLLIAVSVDPGFGSADLDAEGLRDLAIGVAAEAVAFAAG